MSLGSDHLVAHRLSSKRWLSRRGNLQVHSCGVAAVDEPDDLVEPGVFGEETHLETQRRETYLCEETRDLDEDITRTEEGSLLELGWSQLYLEPLVLHDVDSEVVASVHSHQVPPVHSLGALFWKKPCFREQLVDGLLLEVSDGFRLIKVVADLDWSDGDHL